MLRHDAVYHAPIAWSPVGLITWYAEDSTPQALVTPWMALLGGEKPSVRVAWSGRHTVCSTLWRGGDFVLNLPTDGYLVNIRQVICHGQLCLPAQDFSAGNCLEGVIVKAPRLALCPVQVECQGGVLVDNGYESDLCGEVALLHREGEIFGANDVSLMCVGKPWAPVRSFM